MRAGLQEVTRCPEPPLQSTDGPVCNMSTCWRKNCLKFRPFTKNKQGDAENQNRAAGQLTHRLSIKDLGPRPQMQGCGALQAGRGRAATNPWLPVRTEPGRPEHGQEWGLGRGEQGIAAQLGSCRVTGSTSLGASESESTCLGTHDGESKSLQTHNGESTRLGTHNSGSTHLGTCDGGSTSLETHDNESKSLQTRDGESTRLGTHNSGSTHLGTCDGESKHLRIHDNESKSLGTHNGESKSPGTCDGGSTSLGTRDGESTRLRIHDGGQVDTPPAWGHTVVASHSPTAEGRPGVNSRRGLGLAEGLRPQSQASLHFCSSPQYQGPRGASRAQAEYGHWLPVPWGSVLQRPHPRAPESRALAAAPGK